MQRWQIPFLLVNTGEVSMQARSRFRLFTYVDWMGKTNCSGTPFGRMNQVQFYLMEGRDLGFTGAYVPIS